MQTTADEQQMKALMKAAVTEVLLERRDLRTIKDADKVADWSGSRHKSRGSF